MTIEKPVDDETRARLIVELEKRVALARARARVLTGIAVSGVCTVVIAVLLFGALVLRDKTEAEHTNGQRITALTGELADARRQLASTDAVDKETNRCSKRFDATIASSLSDYLAALGGLIVSLGTIDPATPVEQRRTVIKGALDQLDSSLIAYQSAINARSQWQQQTVLLPCPIETS